ncbi:hypothetical protein [Mucilaginibacter lacusdianchii]|uniref:hypothetical protein n=1 Tax=Mucilaginibacter lacusdianchii TaxID=2684211 RepID=UPI00131DCF86|nr:hypothetical protein [Mucilaginibacter sp. JXJ CY 39]
MPTDLKITELPLAPNLTGDEVGILVSNNKDYQFTLDKLLQFVISSFPTGSLGNLVSFATEIPQNNIGKNGDVVINTVNQTFYQKTSNTWVQRYQIPTTTNNSSTGGSVLYGSSKPGISTGNLNDTYISTSNGIFYKKTDSGWTEVFSMLNGPAGGPGPKGDTGATGADGKTILHGGNNPSNQTVGSDGDFYINTTYYTLFGPKTNGDWGSGIPIVDNIDTINQLVQSIGELAYLKTTEKGSLVTAINSIKDELGETKFTEDIPVKLPTGRYLGPFKDGDIIPSKDKTPLQVFQLLATEVVHPKYTAPTALLSAEPSPGIYEVFKSFDITLTPAFIQNDGGAATSISIRSNGIQVGNTAPFKDPYVNSGPTTIAYTAVYSYQQGALKPNNLNLNDPIGQIQAGSTLPSNSLTYTFLYPWFWGKNVANSGFDIYQGNKVVKSSSGALNIDFNTTAGDTYLWFAHDASVPPKTDWKVDELNKGKIGSADSLFASPVKVTVTAPASANFAGWTQSFLLYVSNYTTPMGAITIS